MFGEIYPKGNTREDILASTLHLSEEAGEVDEALLAHSSTHQGEWFEKLTEELVDVATTVFGVANSLKISVALEMVHHFSRGCPKCGHPVCDCDFIPADV